MHRSYLPTLAAKAIAAACTTGLAVAAGMSACITAPPPDLPNPPVQGPTILQGALVPPTDQDLTQSQWPADGMFNVAVLLSESTLSFSIRVFSDFDPGVNNFSGNTGGSTGRIFA